MKVKLSPTKNVQRIMDALRSVELRLVDREVAGFGLVFGQPGLGKTMTIEKYFTDTRRTGRIRCAWLRALGIWTESSMMKDMLEALGISPKQYRKDLMFAQLRETLSQDPALILIDEIDAIAESRKLVGLLKDIHDLSSCAIVMVGEERVDSLLRRYDSFYNRIHKAALVYLTGHTAEDVAIVVRDRCEVAVDRDVTDEMHRTIGKKSMRSVIDRIRDIEAAARNNSMTTVKMADYRQILNQQTQARLKLHGPEPQNKPMLSVLEAVNG